MFLKSSWSYNFLVFSLLQMSYLLISLLISECGILLSNYGWYPYLVLPRRHVDRTFLNRNKSNADFFHYSTVVVCSVCKWDQLLLLVDYTSNVLHPTQFFINTKLDIELVWLWIPCEVSLRVLLNFVCWGLPSSYDFDLINLWRVLKHSFC